MPVAVIRLAELLAGNLPFGWSSGSREMGADNKVLKLQTMS